jgi:TPR repeat protein
LLGSLVLPLRQGGKKDSTEKRIFFLFLSIKNKDSSLLLSSLIKGYNTLISRSKNKGYIITMGNYALKIAEGEALLKGGSLTLEEERAVHVSLALAFHEEGDEPRSLEEFLKAEALGDVDSSLILGYAYLGGRGIEKSVSKAKKHFLKALPSKNPWAYLGLVSLYASEVKDKKKTAYWFEKASQAGIVDAMLAYGEALLKGVVVEPHPLKGRKYLKMAALKGSPEAAYDLAKIYEDGDGLKIDPSKSPLLLPHRRPRGLSPSLIPSP